MNRSIILRVLESYFRHRWLNLMPIVLMLGLGVAYLLFKPPEYLSEGRAYVPGESYLATLTAVRADQTGWWVTPAQNTANEIKDLLRTDTFIRSVIAMTDLASSLGDDPVAVQDLIAATREALWAEPQGDNQVLIGALHEKPVIAYQLASALIDNYTQWRIDSELTQSTVAQAFFADLITQYAAEVATARQVLDDYLRLHPEPVSGDRSYIEQLEIAQLNDEISQAQGRLVAAQDKDENARLAASQTEVNVRQSLYVMDPPTIPSQSTTSKRQLAMQLGMFLGAGLVLSAGAVAGGALLSQGFVFPVDVRLGLHLPVLAIVPEAPAPKRARPGRQGVTSRIQPNEFILSPAPSFPALPPGVRSIADDSVRHEV